MELVITFLMLSFLEIVLGIDNIVFISLIANKVALEKRKLVRMFGLSLSLILRLAMLFCITLLLALTEPIFSYYGINLSIKDLIMLVGGLFLVIKAAMALYEEVMPAKVIDIKNPQKITGMTSAIIQIIVIDFVFSLDSLITAIGLTNYYIIIAGSIIVSILFMIAFVKQTGEIIDKYPAIKVLAISFILLVGFILIAEGLSVHINKGYLYFAIAFSLFVSVINIIMENNRSKKTYK